MGLDLLQPTKPPVSVGWSTHLGDGVSVPGTQTSWYARRGPSVQWAQEFNLPLQRRRRKLTPCDSYVMHWPLDEHLQPCFSARVPPTCARPEQPDDNRSSGRRTSTACPTSTARRKLEDATASRSYYTGGTNIQCQLSELFWLTENRQDKDSQPSI